MHCVTLAGGEKDPSENIEEGREGGKAGSGQGSHERWPELSLDVWGGLKDGGAGEVGE